MIADSFKDFQVGSEEFPKKLEQAKHDFVVVARMAVTGELHPTRLARLRPRLKHEQPRLAIPESIRVAQQEQLPPAAAPGPGRREPPKEGPAGDGERGTVQSP